MAAILHQPVFELTRGNIVESVHFGSIAVVDVNGQLVTSVGDPELVTFLRSSAKPFQVIPFLMAGARQEYNLSERDIAIMCASHSGTDEHVEIISGLQAKLNIVESDLLCGTHPPYYLPAADRLKELGLEPTQNHHNCSGKHTGMLGYQRLISDQNPAVATNKVYIDPEHPIQQIIVSTLAQMAGIEKSGIELGIDGCSAPNFAMPLYRAAYAFARLCDPASGGIDEPSLVSACKQVVSAMTGYPFLVAGPGRLDTQLMQVMKGKLISKSGAEGYQAVGLLPGALGRGSSAVGIAIKISDGDRRGMVKAATTIEVLRQLGALSVDEQVLLGEFGPTNPIRNWKDIEVGISRPTFQLMN